VYEPVAGEYRLEVSSPGIERKLKTEANYKASVGETVKVTLKDKTKAQGKLVSADRDGFTLDINGEQESYPYSNVSKARTFFQW
jgi:ribosome maturation factor RimP